MGATDEEMRAAKARERMNRSARREQGTVLSATGTSAEVSVGISTVWAVIPASVNGVAEGSTVVVQMSNTPTIESILSGPAGVVEYTSSTNQSVADGATARLANWVADETNSVDRGSWSHDGAGLFTCVRSGRYRVTCDATVAGGGSGYWQLMIRVNGTAVRRSWYVQGSTATTGTVRGSRIYAEGDTVDIAVFNSTGGARNVWGGSIDSSWLTIQANP